MVRPIEMPFGMWTRVICLRMGGPDLSTGRGNFGGISQPIVNLGNIRREPEFSLGVSSDAACAVSILQQLVNIDRST